MQVDAITELVQVLNLHIGHRLNLHGLADWLVWTQIWLQMQGVDDAKSNQMHISL